MSFAGKVWKLLVGIKDALVLLFMLFFFGALYAALSTSPYRDSAYSGALRLDLSGPIVEQPVEPSLIDIAGGSVAREYRMRDVIHALETAAESDRIEAVALDLDIFAGGGQAALANVADAIDAVKRSGKPVIAFATAYSDDTYHLASHASEIWLDPLGAVVLTGPGGQQLYYQGLLENLGITANVYRAGDFKSAVEPFTRTDMSPEAREANLALAGALWEQYLDDVGRARPRAQLAAYAQNPVEMMAAAGGDMAQAALRAGLVDRIGDRTQFGQHMAGLVGTDSEDVPGSYRAVDYDAWIEDHPPANGGGRIGVLTVAGNIVDGPAGLGSAGAETVVGNLERGLKQRDLDALVVRIDSPGGSSLASERIRRAIEEVKAAGVPVVVSFGSVAASGGYWIGTVGDTIFAEPSTITGSIGVFGILPSFEGTLDKIGLNADGIQTTPLSGEPDLLNGPSPEVDRLIQMGVDSTYARFLRLVAQSRNMPLPRVAEIAQGRVWDGGTARQLGLVDQFGSLDAAVAEAARRAGIEPDDAEPVWLEEEPGFLAQMLMGMSRSEDQAAPDAFSRIAQRPETLLRQALAEAQALLTGPAIQARCLECPSPAPVRRAGEPSLLALLTGLLRG